MSKQINNWHLSILIIIVSVLSVSLVQRYVLAQWYDPITLPGEGNGFRLVVNPLAENLGLNAHSIIDTDFIINAAGNSGLGTSNPNYKLDVVGNVNATQLCIADDCQANWPGGEWETVSSGIKYTNGYVGIGDDPHSGYLLSLKSSGVDDVLKLDPGLIWAYQSNLNIRSTGNTYLEGNVRVGNNSSGPARLLHVADDNDVWVRVDSGDVANTAQVEFSRGSTNQSWIGPTYENTFDIWTLENMPMLFGINAAERMRLSPDGDLSTQGVIQPGAVDILPACLADNLGSLIWQNDCGSGNGCLQVCSETGWLFVAGN